jgi:hypothetical protein
MPVYSTPIKASILAIDDKLSISGGIIDYIGGSTATDSIKNNDRIFTKISYAF